MKYKEELIVDRIEENHIVVCEDNKGNMINIDIMQMRGTVKEGDIIKLKDGKYEVDTVATSRRKKDIEDMVKGMWVEDEK